MDIGAAVSSQNQLAPEKLDALSDFENSTVLTGREKLVLRLALAMTNTPATVPETLFRQLAAEFSPPALVELVSAIAWENYRARFNRTFDVESQGFSEGAVCLLPHRSDHSAP